MVGKISKHMPHLKPFTTFFSFCNLSPPNGYSVSLTAVTLLGGSQLLGHKTWTECCALQWACWERRVAPHIKKTFTLCVNHKRQDCFFFFSFVWSVLAQKWRIQELLLILLISWLISTSFHSELGLLLWMGCWLVPRAKLEKYVFY